MDWFRKAFAATFGYMTASILYVVVVVTLGAGCCICLLIALAALGQQGQ